MSRNRKSATDVEEIRRALEALPRTESEIPPAEVVYWRAQARLAMVAARQRNEAVVRPLRVFHRAVGVIAFSVGALTALWPLVLPPSVGAGLFAVTLSVTLVSTGAWLLAETQRAA